jgi:hypothetical protein
MNDPDGKEGIRPDIPAVSPIYSCSAVSGLASHLISGKMKNPWVEVDGRRWSVKLRGVANYRAPACFLPHARRFTNGPDHGGENRTLLVVECTGAPLAMFDAVTGEIVGPMEIQISEAEKFGAALSRLLAEHGEEGFVLDEEFIRTHAQRESFLNSWVADYFSELSEYGIRSASNSVVLDELDRLFPLPHGVEPFSIAIVSSDPRYDVRVEKTSNIFRALALAWHHDRKVNFDRSFDVLREIDPRLESTVKVEFGRLFTKSQAVRTMR